MIPAAELVGIALTYRPGFRRRCASGIRASFSDAAALAAGREGQRQGGDDDVLQAAVGEVVQVVRVAAAGHGG